MHNDFSVHDREIILYYLKQNNLDKVETYTQVYDLVSLGLSKQGFCLYMRFVLVNDCCCWEGFYG